MNKLQRKILKYIYHSPRTFEEIENKFKIDDAELKETLFGDNYFDQHFDGIKAQGDFHKNQIKINNYGKSYIDDRFEDNFKFYLVLIIDTALSVAAIIISFIALFN